MSKEIIYDLSNLQSALESLSSLINTKPCNIRAFILKNRNCKDDIEKRFIETFNLNVENIDISNLYLKIQHVTTSLNDCKDIKRYGLLNTQEAIKKDTSLKRYLLDKDISIDFTNKKIIYKDDIIDEFIDNKKIKLCYTKLFNENNYPINGFIYGDNPVAYGGGINKAPEIISNLANAFNGSIYTDWRNKAKCFIIEYKAHVYDFNYDVFTLLRDDYKDNRDLVIKEWIVQYSIILIRDLLLYKNSSDKYSFMKESFKVNVNDIINIIQK